MPFLKELKEVVLPVRQPDAGSARQGPGTFMRARAWPLPLGYLVSRKIKIGPGLWTGI